MKGSAKEHGFTVVEVIVAASIMIVLCVGLLSVTAYVVNVNRGENVRMQALSVLQQDAEYIRALKFVPVGSSAELNAGTYSNVRTRTAQNGRQFNISVTVANLPAGTTDANCKLKEIRVTAVPVVAETGWLANLNTTLVFQRVRSN